MDCFSLKTGGTKNITSDSPFRFATGSYKCHVIYTISKVCVTQPPASNFRDFPPIYHRIIPSNNTGICYPLSFSNTYSRSALLFFRPTSFSDRASFNGLGFWQFYTRIKPDWCGLCAQNTALLHCPDIRQNEMKPGLAYRIFSHLVNRCANHWSIYCSAKLVANYFITVWLSAAISRASVEI